MPLLGFIGYIIMFHNFVMWNNERVEIYPCFIK